MGDDNRGSSFPPSTLSVHPSHLSSSLLEPQRTLEHPPVLPAMFRFADQVQNLQNFRGTSSPSWMPMPETLTTVHIPGTPTPGRSQSLGTPMMTSAQIGWAGNEVWPVPGNEIEIGTQRSAQQVFSTAAICICPHDAAALSISRHKYTNIMHALVPVTHHIFKHDKLHLN